MARIREASALEDVDSVRELFREYARSVDEPCCFAGFEREVLELPHGYALIFLAEDEEGPAGCVALRALDVASAEVKRLYVRPRMRGRGLGRDLIVAAIAAARKNGYQRVVLDSLPSMQEALGLYRSLGFRAIPPYLAEPTAGASCFELKL
jgi:ribosomal protein S18 acetylase RimI-like enzyme